MVRGTFIESSYTMAESKKYHRDHVKKPHLARHDASLCCMQNLIADFSDGHSLSNLYTENSKLSGLIAIDGEILKKELSQNRQAEIRYWKYMAAQFCFLMPEKFPILNSVSYHWVEGLINRCCEIEFLAPN